MRKIDIMFNISLEFSIHVLVLDSGFDIILLRLAAIRQNLISTELITENSPTILTTNHVPHKFSFGH